MHDYARFCQCIANGGELGGHRLLGVKTVEWMASNHLPGGLSMDQMPVWSVAGLDGYSENSGPGVGGSTDAHAMAVAAVFLCSPCACESLLLHHERL